MPAPGHQNSVCTLIRELAMKAIRIHEPTGISGLVYEEAPDATPMIGDVLVKVAACGITHNELDWPLWTCRNGHQRTSITPATRYRAWSPHSPCSSRSG
jgi:hypothetical protein